MKPLGRVQNLACTYLYLYQEAGISNVLAIYLVYSLNSAHNLTLLSACELKKLLNLPD